MSVNIVLIQPEIPPNTGNIARSCAATGAALHLVRPLGFSIDEKDVRRAGLDYWSFVDLKVHDDMEEFIRSVDGGRMWLATTKGERFYSDVSFEPGDYLLFGSETKGLPAEFIKANSRRTLRIPLSENTRSRSLNLANSVSIIMFEALRQLGFPGLQ